MDLTKKQAILEHRKMWNWIADEIEDSNSVKDIDDLKEEYCEKNKFDLTCNCFCCEYSHLNCNLCPVEWNSELKEFMCENKYVNVDNKGVYSKCYLSKDKEEQTQLARQIANLPERENV